MSHAEPTLKDIAKMLAMLKPEQIAGIMKNIPVRNGAYKIDYSERIRKLAINALYFSSATYPHNHDSFEEYKEHDEGIRQQVLSGVSL
jgi:CMP-2-keto-3-deoxyoctulosonic acid synthetase